MLKALVAVGVLFLIAAIGNYFATRATEPAVDTRIEISELSTAALEEIKQIQVKTYKALGLSEKSDPKTVVEKIQSVLETAKAEGREVDSDSVVGMGTLLSEQYVRAMGWHWSTVMHGANETNACICILSKDDAHAMNGISVIADSLRELKKVEISKTFNLALAGELPPAVAGQALLIN